MRTAEVFFDKELAGLLVEQDNGHFIFVYNEGYAGKPVSLTMPVDKRNFDFATFPPIGGR